jgi:hypothetical protein
LKTSPDHQHVSVELLSSFKQCFLDGTHSDSNGRMSSHSSLQLGNALTCLLAFLRLNLLLVFQSNGQIWIGGLDGMNNVEVTARFQGRQVSVAEYSF